MARPDEPPTYPYDHETARAALAEADPALGALMERVGPYRLGLRPPLGVFQELLRAIVYQQLSGRAAAAIFDRLCALTPGRGAPSARAILDLDAETLRGAGLSGAKVAAVRDLAARTRARRVPSLQRLRGMPDEAVIEALTEIRGVGRWTVEMLLMFKLGRADVMPATDLGIRKGFMLTFEREDLPAPGEVLGHAERWRPYRTVAAWYLWRAVEPPQFV